MNSKKAPAAASASSFSIGPESSHMLEESPGIYLLLNIFGD